MKFLARLALAASLSQAALAAPSVTVTPPIPTSRPAVIETIRKVNDAWQAKHPNHGDAFWNRAAYHTGNMAAFKATGIEAYRAYSEAWAEKNLWQGAKSNDRKKLHSVIFIGTR